MLVSCGNCGYFGSVFMFFLTFLILWFDFFDDEVLICKFVVFLVLFFKKFKFYYGALMVLAGQC